MKRRLYAALSLMLCLLLLTGCGSKEGMAVFSDSVDRINQARADAENGPVGKDAERAETDGDRRTIPFSQIEYVRPELDEMEELLELLRQDLETGSYSTVEKRLDQIYEAYDHFNTMSSLAYILSSRDMTDEYYAQETAWCDEQTSELNRLMEQVYYACGMSDMADTLERRYFWEGFAAEYADDSEAIYDDEMVALYQQEANLLAQYRELIASPTIVLANGQEADLYSYLETAPPFAYYNAVLRYYNSYNEPIGRVFIELVKVRAAIAEKLGYDSYEQMQYEYYWERDYSPEQAENYLTAIREELVPLYLEISQWDPYSRIDYSDLSEQAMTETLESAVRAMGGQMEEAFDFMRRYGVYDVGVDSRKLNSSFQTYLDEYDTPFLFMCPNGSTEDLSTFAHEFGHFTEAYVNWNAYETIDAAEVYSQAMEYLMLFYLDGRLDASDLENLTRMKMLDTLEMYVEQASFAEFEHRLYAIDPEELTVETINQLSLEMAEQYGYAEPGYETFYSHSWIDIVHFFEMPFYVITYPVSNDLALQIYELELEAPGAGLEKFGEMLPRDSANMLEIASAAGLQSPFAPGRILKAAEDIRGILNEEALAA